MKTPAFYSDGLRDLYTEASCLTIAKRVRRYGQRQAGTWWADADTVGVLMRRAMFWSTTTRHDLPVHQWFPVGDGLELYIDGTCRADFPGRFVVRRVQP